MPKFAVFYANVGYVRDMFEDFYRETINDKSEKPFCLTLGEFYSKYNYVGTFEADSLEYIFGHLQDGGGGLGDRNGVTTAGMVMQKLVIKKAGHTSMSAMDIAVSLETGLAYICRNTGWGQVKILG